MTRIALLALAAALASCAAKVAPEVLQQWQATPRYTCCNIHYENPAKIADANYYVGATLPLGSQVVIESMSDEWVTFRVGATSYSVRHAYGTEQESGEQFFAKLLVEQDPTLRLATFSPAVQEAIRDSRVEVGMTREEVLMSLGYPPTHRTPSLEASSWTYWYNRWVTYQVNFGADGRVTSVLGSNAPTRAEPVVAPAKASAR